MHLTLLLYRGVYITPPTKKWQLLLKIVILKSPNFVTFPIYLWQTLPYLFWGSKCQKKRCFYNIFVVSGTNLRIIKFSFLVFFESKMTKIVILDQKQIVPNDHQQFWVHFDWFLSLFRTLDVKYLLSPFKLKVRKNRTFWSQILFFKIFSMVLWSPTLSYAKKLGQNGL